MRYLAGVSRIRARQHHRNQRIRRSADGSLSRRTGTRLPARLSVMQSNGGLLTASEARRHAVRTILSGPAGGIAGAVEIARLAGFKRALTFDMGGTSTDVALAGGKNRLSTEARIDGFPVRVPMLDIHTAGAGGGSIAYIDAGGSLRWAGKRGRIAGSACYGAGERATVTDAHVVLGRIASDQLVGGALQMDPARAEQALERLGKPLGLSAIEAAAAVIRITNSNMERAIRAVSVERGEDPREYPLVAFGGCGGLHACEMAEELGIRTVIVPAHGRRPFRARNAAGRSVRDYSAGALGVATLTMKNASELREAGQKRCARSQHRTFRRYPLCRAELRTHGSVEIRQSVRGIPQGTPTRIRLFRSKTRHADRDTSRARDSCRETPVIED